MTEELRDEIAAVLPGWATVASGFSPPKQAGVFMDRQAIAELCKQAASTSPPEQT